jgi:hypothetical protein
MALYNNKIKMSNRGYGVYVSNCLGTPSNPIDISNNSIIVGNSISTRASYGIYLTAVNRANLYHNSVHLSSLGVSSRALDAANSGSLNINNNIFSKDGPGYSVYFTSGNGIGNMDHNCLHTSNGTKLAFFFWNRCSYYC